MSDRLVACHDVGRTYGRGHLAVVAVHGVSCAVDVRERVALVGASGSGKTTLLHLMAGLDQPTSGSVSWPSWSTGPFQDPSRAGVVFQGSSLMPALTAVENVAFPLLLQGVPYDEAAGRARDSLDLFGLSGLGEKLPDELSGGQAQRIAVARAVTTRPSLILADEPTGQLDRFSATRVIDVLIEAADHLGAGLVVTTHDALVAARLDVVWQMHDGELAGAA